MPLPGDDGRARPSTLLVRLMAAGPLLPQAIEELSAPPEDAHERAAASRTLLKSETAEGAAQVLEQANPATPTPPGRKVSRAPYRPGNLVGCPVRRACGRGGTMPKGNEKPKTNNKPKVSIKDKKKKKKEKAAASK